MGPKSTPKRKAKSPEDVEDTEGDEEEVQPTKKSKPKPKKAKVPTEPFTGNHGWEVEPHLYLLWRKFGSPTPSKKVAAFDLDGTLLLRKRGNAGFTVSPDDWKWFNKTVPKTLEDYHAKGYSLVIFSNQNSIKSSLEGKAAQNNTQRVENALSEVKAPFLVFFATEKNDQRKPQTGMWEFFRKHCSGGVEPDLKQSFFVGDMAGRPEDIDVTDKEFAKNVGLGFKTPEECFGEGDTKKGPPISKDGVNRNPELTEIFTALAEKNKENRWAMIANNKVAKIVESFPEKITSSAQIASVKGVGKGSLGLIDEFLKTGRVAALEADAKKEAAASVPTKESVAFKFA